MATLVARVLSAAAAARRTASSVLIPTGERERTQRDALVAFGVRVASAAILYLSQIALARWMGSHEYGVYVFVWTWVLMLGGLSALGMGASTVRLMAEYREKCDAASALGLARGTRALCFGTGTLVAMLGLGGLWLFGSLLDPGTLLPAYLALVCLPLYAVEHVQDGLARGNGWIATALVPPFVLRPLLLLVFMATAWKMGLPMTAVTAAAAAIAAVWMATFVQLALLNHKLRRAYRLAAGEKRTYAFGHWIGVSLPILAAYGCELVIQNADVLVVSRYMSPTDVAIYFAAAKTMALILFVHYAVGSAAAARFSALNARGDRAGLEAFVKDAARWTFWPSLAAAAAILALGAPLLSLFGPEFAAGYPVMFILVLGFLGRSAVGPAETLLNMLGEQRICAVVLMVTATLNVALNFALVPRFGLNGAATASALALVAGAAMSYLAARRRLGLDMAVWASKS